jgi:3-oxoacyl-[acyl-carrier-protein] synthase III
MSLIYDERLRVGAFACEYGDRERSFETIEDYDALRTERKISLSLSALGCKLFNQMTGRLEDAVKASIKRTLEAAMVSPGAVSHVLFATSDNHLHHVHDNFAREILIDLSLDRAIPTILSLQQCVSSLTAVHYAHRLFAEPDVEHVVVACFDLVSTERDRIQSFALFGDAVSSCLVSREIKGGFALKAYRLGIDRDGLQGRDSFESRKKVASAALTAALAQADTGLSGIEACFSTNFFKPIALFNANICGIPSNKLAIPTLSRRAHCGNCDWMMNLVDHQENAGVVQGGRYLANAFAPGFYACAVLAAAG